MQWTIGRDCWRSHLQSQGAYYGKMAEELIELHRRDPSVGAGAAALAVQSLRELFERARAARLTRHQHVLFRLGELAMQAETAGVYAKAVVDGGDARFSPPVRKAMARIYARDSAANVANEAIKWLRGCNLKDDLASMERGLKLPQIHEAQAGLLSDLDEVAAELTGRESTEGRLAS